MALIWGRHPVYEALKAGRSVDRVLIAEGVRPTGLIADVLRLSSEHDVRVQWLDRKILDRMSAGANHQGVLAEVAEYRYRSLAELVDAAEGQAGLPWFLVLDSLEDPQNFGTLLRTADATGVSGVIIPLHRSVGVTPAVEKASAGAVEYVPIARVTNLARALQELKRRGYWVVGMDSTGNEIYDRFPVDVPLALVVGSEGSGIGRLVRENCDVLIRLPMRGHVESLNAAVAGSVVLYDVLRRRGFSS